MISKQIIVESSIEYKSLHVILNHTRLFDLILIFKIFRIFSHFYSVDLFDGLKFFFYKLFPPCFSFFDVYIIPFSSTLFLYSFELFKFFFFFFSQFLFFLTQFFRKSFIFSMDFFIILFIIRIFFPFFFLFPIVLISLF